jgi:hypothetical protein
MRTIAIAVRCRWKSTRRNFDTPPSGSVGMLFDVMKNHADDTTWMARMAPARISMTPKMQRPV